MIVTVIALALAIGMSVLAWRLLRDNRLRSTARAEALLAMAAEDEPEERFSTLDDDEGPEAWDLARAQTATGPAKAGPYDRAEPAGWTAGGRGVRLQPDQRGLSASRRPRPAPVAEPLFAATVTSRPGAPSRRWAALAIVGIVMAALVSAIYTAYRPVEAAESAFADWVPDLRTRAPRPLELLSLRHHSDAATFTVTGLVQNPPSGVTVSRAIAVVYLFDRDGSYFASGKATLEFDRLQPGDESPFVVRVPNTSRVARYRVGFRSEEGGVIAHIDRRGQPPSGTTGDSLDAPGTPRGAVVRGSESRP
jgi:hypothetical protein